MQEELERLRRLVQEGGAAVGSTPAGASMSYAELAELYARLLEDRDRIATEAEAMRDELSAFDPAFFEELEDLKYEFEQVKIQNQKYVRAAPPCLTLPAPRCAATTASIALSCNVCTADDVRSVTTHVC